ncbi:MAG: thioredoxin [Vicinamibacteria bacterium]|nr:thioredoxin [Vicinamibacteria bacterium]
MPENVVEITDANFTQITKNGVTLVDFWAERCPPCRAQGPIVDKLAETYAGRVTIGKLDVDSHREAATDLGLYCIPTLILFKDGKELKRFTGLQTEASLSSALERALRTAKESANATL